MRNGGSGHNQLLQKAFCKRKQINGVYIWERLRSNDGFVNNR